MKAILNIENDKEIRLYVKDLIKGQVHSVIRDEFKILIKEELSRLIAGQTGYNLSKTLPDATAKAIRDILQKEHNVSLWNSEFIKPFVEDAMKDALKYTDFAALVNRIATEKIKSLL